VILFLYIILQKCEVCLLKIIIRNKKMITCTTWSRILGHLGRFLGLGCFEAWTFCILDVLELGRFEAWDVLWLWTFCILDVLELGRFGAGTLCIWTFCLWTFCLWTSCMCTVRCCRLSLIATTQLTRG
jgi:hypothetical protein